MFHTLSGGIATLLLLFLVPYKKPPHPILQFLLGLSAFVFSICWLNVEANEVVSTLETFGLLFDIDSGQHVCVCARACVHVCVCKRSVCKVVLTYVQTFIDLSLVMNTFMSVHSLASDKKDSGFYLLAAPRSVVSCGGVLFHLQTLLVPESVLALLLAVCSIVVL